MGILEIACGCPSLEMINVAYCTDITDGSLISLSKCSELKTLEIRGCLHVTSNGLAAIALNCKQLSRLDIKKCYNIDDSGMIPLARYSQNLRQVFFLVSHGFAKLKRCKKFLCHDSHNMPFILQINLSYSSVTDVGLLSLASISCLHTFTVLHLQGVTPRGLAAALLAFGGLRKVKLHLSLRSLFPEPLIKHIEARGCVFEWRNKEFQVYECSGSYS